MLARVFTVMTAAAVTSSLLFNFTTNGNAQLMNERFVQVISDPAMLGTLLAVVYVIASFAQIVIGHLIDRMQFKPLTLAMSVPLIPILALAAYANGWWLYVLMLAVMILIFGSIPFTDAMIVRYVDDRLRSRVAGMRLTVAFGISSAAVWLLGPLVKNVGFATALLIMAAIAAVKAGIVLMLPDEREASVRA
jgi:MFS family permease